MKIASRTAVVLLCAALALRAGWVVYCWASQGPALEYPDEQLHWQLAANLVRHGTLITDDGRMAPRMPAYPLFLAVFAGLGQTGILAARLAQAGLGTGTVGLVYWLARSALGRRAALVCGLLACCDPFAIFFSNLILTEVLFTLIATGLTACAWRWLVSRGESLAALLGLAVLGPLAVLTRASAAGWIPLLWLLLVWMGRHSRQRLLCLAVCPAVLVACLLPWGVRNKIALDSFAWLSTNGGASLYDGQGPQADGSGNQAFLHELPELQDLDEVGLDQTLTRMAFTQMRLDPQRVLRLAGRKLLRTWNPLPNVAEYRSGWPAAIGAGYTIVLLLTAAAGSLRGIAGWARQPAGCRSWLTLLWLPVVYFTLVHCVYVGSVRYRVPLHPLLGLAAGGLFRPITGLDQPGSGRS